MDGLQFSGSVLDIFHLLPIITGFTVVAGYSVLGAGWLYLKSNTVVQRFARVSLRAATPTFVALFGIACFYAASIQHGIRSAWAIHFAALLAITLLFLLSGGTLSLLPFPRWSLLPFLLGLSLLLSGILGLALVVFPNVIPFRISLWDAASPSASQRFLLIGATLVTPVILAYSAFAYWVFRGRAPEQGWEQ